MDVMDEFRKKIWEGNKEISHTKFEGKILSVLNRQDIDYHFCEYISQAFKEDSRWEEVFSTLYGDQLKYRG